MAGLDTEYSGEAWAAEGAKVGYLEQEPQLNPSKDVLGNVMEGVAEKLEKVERYNELAMNYSDETADEMASLQDELDSQNLWDLDSQVEQAMDALRCPPSDASVDNLSGGEKRRVALCKLLLSKPDMLLLDEPTNHLDAETVAWLQHYLSDYAGTVVLVTHDRYFLDQVTGWILELDRGSGFPYEGNYSSWLEQKHKRLEQEAREDASRQRTLSRELEWIQASPKARQAKSKARISAYEDLVNQKEREEVGRAQISIPAGPRLGGVVIEADNLTKGFDEKLLIDNLSFQLPPGGIVGVIGPNGAGKTTLFKMLTGVENPDDGNLKVRETVVMGYVDQSRDNLDDGKTVWEEISDGNDIIELGNGEVNSRAYVGAFNFRGGDQQKKVGLLSGGERNRVHLARCFAQEQICCCLMSQPMILMLKPFAHLKRGWKISQAVRLLFLTIAGFWTGSLRIFWLLRATAMWNGLKVATQTMKSIEKPVLGRMLKCPSVLNTNNLVASFG